MKKKKMIIFFGIVAIAIIALSITIPMYINRLDTTNLDAIATKVKENKKLNKHFDSVWLRKVKDTKNQFDLSLKAKPAFTTLSDKEKLLLAGKVMEVVQENSHLNEIKCGRNKTCSINEIFILPSDEDDKTSSYEVKYSPLNHPEENVLIVSEYQNDDPNSHMLETREVKYQEDGDEGVDTLDEDYQEKTIAIGMTKHEVIQLKDWGRPKSIHKTTTASGINEQWVYGISRYLYFDNGVLTTIQE
ncbi:hypothetical protein [Bacillus velezensis]|uniref:Uncharacterized protein n=1 Tax=Bacillus amyloliquefaciens (strain Y2) TaxID=1155777 RepID=I2C5I1_BACAY|nr:hypothetical protein [Bacillus velezensis]AFJ61905.1 hypothetical protein MUS_1920 [Bacillus velezensis YAU B9601-Y2]AUG35870.1 hypothetical protein CXP43_09065 [Bacillus velezensis]MCK6099661.1 hypothetical protein [Bacillus velezensis]MCK6200710.1 hypothetical protein [Bacillus velezensis]QRL09020.1 hypothetical protein GKO36_08910 [Bacillus velezensis]